MRRTLPGAALAAIVLGTTFVGCPCIDAPVNASPWLRWKLFAAFGADRVCAEMSKRSAPLRLQDNAPSLGRFFPSSCQSSTDDNRRTVTIRFAGDGYAWHPLTGKVSFTTGATVEYAPDFRLDGDTIYAWFRPASQPAPTFQLNRAERSPDVVTQLVSPVANQIAGALVASELARGFTVIHDGSGDDFALGILQPPARPAHPWTTHGDDRVTLATDTTDVHVRSAEFVGPLEVDANGRSLFVRLSVSGPAVDLAVVPRDVGETWRRQYEAELFVRPPTAAPIVTAVAQPGADVERPLALPRGQYYLVIDNSDGFGQVQPPPVLPLVGDAPARVNYLITLGDTP